jgi:hypothetical protein
MRNQEYNHERRSFLRIIVTLVLAGGAGLFGRLKEAAAMGDQSAVQGLHRVSGEVRVNDVIVKQGATVGPDDVISTGAGSEAVFVVGKDAFLIREKSRVELGSGTEKGAGSKGTPVILTLRMKAGKLLSVFGRGKKTFVTATAVCGVRGTGIYVEAEADRTYVCTCYGEVDLEAADAPDQREIVKTTHHEAPRYIYAKGTGRMIATAPMKNHTDQELIMLESLVKRRPPFVQSPFGEYHDPYQ